MSTRLLVGVVVGGCVGGGCAAISQPRREPEKHRKTTGAGTFASTESVQVGALIAPNTLAHFYGSATPVMALVTLSTATTGTCVET